MKSTTFEIKPLKHFFIRYYFCYCYCISVMKCYDVAID